LTATTPIPPATRRILNSIAQISRRALKFIFTTITAAILAGMILAMLLPPAAFAWRASRPMNDPLFKGLSFFQVTKLRYKQYQVFVTHYNESHPADDIMEPGMCFWTELANSLTNACLAEVCTLAKCSGLAVVPTGLVTYPAAIWANFEDNLVFEFNRTPQQPVAACRLPPSFPSPGNSDSGP
jgi:hypothetical protein